MRPLGGSAKCFRHSSPASGRLAGSTSPYDPTDSNSRSFPENTSREYNGPSIRNLLCGLLERRGYFGVEVRRVQDLALELKDRGAGLLVIDVSITRGVETAIALARIHPNFKILALVAGSLNDSEIPGRLEVLAKPFTLDSFMNCVDLLLDRLASPETETR